MNAHTDCHANGLLNDTDRANLRLIASSPDLLGALRLAVARLEEYQDAEGGIALECARAAIAAAKGTT